MDALNADLEKNFTYHAPKPGQFVGMAKARNAIVDSLGGPWKRGTPGASGTIDCPVCDGKKMLQFSRAGYNGHIHAACGTDGCVCWME